MVLGPGDEPPVGIKLSLLWRFIPNRSVPRFTPSAVLMRVIVV